MARFLELSIRWLQPTELSWKQQENSFRCVVWRWSLGTFECQLEFQWCSLCKTLLFPLELLAGTFFTYDNIINVLFY